MIIVKVPLRISFIGGGSDIKAFYSQKDGQVISSAIDKFIYVIVKERFDNKIYINYSQKECVDCVDDIKHDLVRETMRLTGIENGVEITTLADIPSSGTGLGSSSSVTVGLLHAFYTYKNQLVTQDQLAEQACHIEIDVLGKPIGKQDQYAVAFGGINHFIFKSDSSVERVPVVLSNGLFRKLSSSLLLYFTGITRNANIILSEQTKQFSKSKIFETMNRMVNYVPSFLEAVYQGNIDLCGQLLEKNWLLKKEMATGISNDLIEFMYEKAKKAGASGGKISGAGGGGFLLLLVPRDRQSVVFDTMKKYRELPFILEKSGSKVIFDYRTYNSK